MLMDAPEYPRGPGKALQDQYIRQLPLTVYIITQAGQRIFGGALIALTNSTKLGGTNFSLFFNVHKSKG